jgi:transposase-like protein
MNWVQGRGVGRSRNASLLPANESMPNLWHSQFMKQIRNLIEQNHRGINSRAGPMLGFKDFDCAAATITGIELLRRIRKGQFALGNLRLKNQTAPATSNAVLPA